MRRRATEYKTMTNQQKFEAFDEGHPEVYTHLVERARQVKARGVHKYGMDTLYELARWHFNFERDLGEEREDYKLNDIYGPYYARKIMGQEADLEGFFNTRRLRVP